ncbi:MAG: aquaporin [Bdellovibrionales bacterium]
MFKEVDKYIAEFLGTFFLVFFGCGSVIVHQLDPVAAPGFIIPVVFGATVSVIIYTIGHISGAHLNPAVTVAFYFSRTFPISSIPGYVFFQIAGAVAASMVHYGIWGASSVTTLVTTLSVDPSRGLLIEVLISFFLMFVVIGVATDTRAVGELAGIAIGFAVAISVVGGPLTGASMNPARTIGPALVSGNFDHLIVYRRACDWDCTRCSCISKKILCGRLSSSD